MGSTLKFTGVGIRRVVGLVTTLWLVTDAGVDGRVDSGVAGA